MFKTKKMIVAALMAAVMCILAPISIPVSGGIGISLGVFVILLMAYLLEFPMCIASCIVYLIMGFIGLPVFAGYQGGLGVLMGPSGGFLIGYILLVSIAGSFSLIFKGKRILFAVGAFVGLLLCYLLGILWYMHIMKVGFIASVMVCVVPFIAFDIIKILLVSMIGPIIKKRVD